MRERERERERESEPESQRERERGVSIVCGALYSVYIYFTLYSSLCICLLPAFLPAFLHAFLPAFLPLSCLAVGFPPEIHPITANMIGRQASDKKALIPIIYWKLQLSEHVAKGS